MFIKKREKQIDNLKVVFQEFEHESGTKHYHLKSESNENCFVISFPTLPTSDDGRAHILEHLVLCGSEKFQTHDPFFAMTRRSLATFMNAMTYGDKTAYPFATTDKKDYFNLLSVYLDATFFPKLDYFNFLQEGWRYELKNNSELSYAGVVYNEMKGALSDKSHHIYREIEKQTKKGTIYCNESGGDPISIPSLKYEDLKKFHSENYHPSRATIMTYGDIDPEEIQKFFEQEVVSKINTTFPRVKPELSKLENKQHFKEAFFPAQEEDKESEYMVIFNWLLGQSDSSLVEDYQVFSHILTSEGGFLCNALEDANLGRPSEFVGTMSHSLEATFHLGLEGLKENEVDDAKKYIIEKIKEVSIKGVSKEVIEAGIDDIESEIKNLNSGRMPYGLSLLLNGLSFASNEKDPLSGIDHEKSLNEVRERFSNQNYIKELALRLLDNIPMVCIKFVPKVDFFKERNNEESSRLAKKYSSLTEKDKQAIIKESETLLKMQRKEYNYDCLPQIKPTEVERRVKEDKKFKIMQKEGHPTLAYLELPTNGISYINAVFDINHLNKDDWKWCQLLSLLLPGMPSKNENWIKSMEKRGVLCKNIEFSVNAVFDINDNFSGKVLFEMNSFHLERKNENILQIMEEFLENISFEDKKRIKQIISQELSEYEQNISNYGNMLASQEAKDGFNFMTAFNKETTGINYINFLRSFLIDCDNKSKMNSNISKIKEIYMKVTNSKSVIFGSGSKQTIKLLEKIQNRFNLDGCDSAQLSSVSILKEEKINKKLLVASTEINYCHTSLPVENIKYKDKKAVYLDLAAQLMTHNYLHPVLREQSGAYGAGASYSVFNGIFSFSTYRDPNLLETFEEFNKVLHWFSEEKFSNEQLNEAKISLLQNFDKPTTPKNEFENAISLFFMGIDEKMRLNRKIAIIDADIDNVLSTAKEFLTKEKMTKCAFISSESLKKHSVENFDIHYV